MSYRCALKKQPEAMLAASYAANNPVLFAIQSWTQRRREMAATLLCVDDHQGELLLRKEVLQRCGYTVLTAADGFAAVEIAEQTPVALVVLDYRLDGMDGEAIAKVLKTRRPGVPIVLLSAYDVPSHVLELVDASISKGESPDVLIHTIQSLLRVCAGRVSFAQAQAGR